MGSTSPTEAGALSVWDLSARGWSPVYPGVCEVGAVWRYGEPGGLPRAAGGGLGLSEACASPQIRSAALASRAKAWASGVRRLDTRAWMSSGATSLTLPSTSLGISAVL